jgi:radical SAM-linked protein
MRKQLIFSKTGLLKFVGHLDMMRTMQRALNRAKIPLSYTQGFNPHPHMTFANPLGLGCSGENEIMEIRTEKDISDQDLFDRLNAQLPKGLHVKAVRTLPDTRPAIMSLIKAAEYQILLPDPAGKEAFGIDWKAAVDNLMQQDTVTITRTGKVHGQKRKIEVNARPLIYEAKVEDGRLLKVLCACGSEENLKIDLLVDALYRSIDRMDLARMETIDRVALYIRREDGSLQEESDFSNWPVHE